MEHNKLIIFIDLIVLSLLILFISGCSNEQTPESNTTFDELMAIDDINNTIKISYLDFMSEGLDANNLYIGLQNYSTKRLEFPVNWGVRIFMDQVNQEGWIEVENEGTYLPSIEGGYPFLSPKGNDLAQTAFMIHPIIGIPDQPIFIRVFVTGNILSSISTPGRLVAAYVDISLKP